METKEFILNNSPKHDGSVRVVEGRTGSCRKETYQEGYYIMDKQSVIVK